MGTFIDLTGQRFGRLVVLEKAGADRNKKVRWRALCECGNEVLAYGANLRQGRARSCGCLSVEKAAERMGALRRRHSMSRTPIYRIWKAMVRRCENKNTRDYRWYGGAGVRVCERWRTFENFYADMGDAPEGRSIDRIDPYGDYGPDNCRWATWPEQVANKRANFAPLKGLV